MPAKKRNDVEFKDRRRTQRISVSRDGRLVGPFSDLSCTFQEISETGAKVEAPCVPQVGDDVAVELPRVGYARGKVVRLDDGAIYIAFDCSDPAQNRIARRIDRLSV